MWVEVRALSQRVAAKKAARRHPDYTVVWVSARKTGGIGYMVHLRRKNPCWRKNRRARSWSRVDDPDYILSHPVKLGGKNFYPYDFVKSKRVARKLVNRLRKEYAGVRMLKRKHGYLVVAK